MWDVTGFALQDTYYYSLSCLSLLQSEIHALLDHCVWCNELALTACVSLRPPHNALHSTGYIANFLYNHGYNYILQY